MKKLLYAFVVVLLISSCSGYHTMPKFYERYKESPSVKAYQLPKFKEQIMDSFSPYTRNLLLDVVDLRYMKLTESDINNNELLKIEIKGLFRRRFRDLEREISNDSLKIVSMKVSKDNIATDFLVFQNKGMENTILYLAGDMDPKALKEFFEDKEHDKMINVMHPENFEEIDPNLKAVKEKQNAILNKTKKNN